MSLSHEANGYIPSHRRECLLTMPQYQFLTKPWLRKTMVAADHIFIMLLSYLKSFSGGCEWQPPTVDVGSCTPPSSRRQTEREDTHATELKLIFLFLAASWWVVIVPFCQRLFNVFQTVPFCCGMRDIWWQILQSPAEFPLTDAVSVQS